MLQELTDVHAQYATMQAMARRRVFFAHIAPHRIRKKTKNYLFSICRCGRCQVELKKREDLLRGWGVGGDPSPVTAANCFWSQYDAAEGIPLVLADFLEQIHLPDPVLELKTDSMAMESHP